MLNMTETKTPEAQRRAIDAQALNGTPYARTKKEAEAERDALAETLTPIVSLLGMKPPKSRRVLVTTWMNAAGDSTDIGLDSRDDGLRLNVHRWHSTGETQVRLIKGSWFRPAKGREGVEYANALVRPTNAGYAVYVGGWRVAMLKTERGAILRAAREALKARP